MLILDREEVRPNSRFCDADVAYVLVLLIGKNHVSRIELSNYLQLCESSVRSLLGIMEAHRLISRSRKGVSITDEGRFLYREMGIRIIDIDVPYVLGSYKQAIKVEGAADKVTDGIMQVKLSTLSGGLGCTTWIRQDNVLFMPSPMTYRKEDVEFTRMIQDVAKLSDGDVFLVCGGESKRAARIAAMTVALDLV